MKKCLQCGKEYEAIRSSSKYCSSQCRKLAFQSKEVTVPLDKEVTVPLDLSHPEQLTDEQRIGKVIKGYCHACGRDITTIAGLMSDGKFMSQEMANSICICYNCHKEGHTHESLGITNCEDYNNQ